MNEILSEMNDNLREMEKLINSQNFRIEDAHKFLLRYYNIYRKMEELEKSRDKWKLRYIELKNKK